MSFATRANGPAPKAVPGAGCSVGVLLSKLPKPERAGLQKMLDDPEWGHIAIYRSILDEGHEVAKLAVGRHRKRECSCALRKS